MNQSILAVLLAIFSLQIGASLAKELFPVLGPLGATSLRILFAALILFVVFRPWKKPLNKAQRKQVFIFGACIGIMNLCFYKALQYIPQGLVVAIEFTGPLVLSCILSKKKSDFLWILLAALGLLMILPLKETEAALSFIGIFYSLAAGFFWALYIYLGKKVGTNQGTGSIAWAMGAATVVTLPVGYYEQGAALFSWNVIPLGIAVALLSSVIPYSLELFALKKIPAKTFGILLSLEPAVAVLSGFLFLAEKITSIQLVAILFISLASLGSTLSVRAKEVPLQN